ncbi:MAG: hypothetical protein PHS54_01320 [Clostridia bacterium]|nr:hypothetical protein [Clostridia bacterium]
MNKEQLEEEMYESYYSQVNPFKISFEESQADHYLIKKIINSYEKTVEEVKK